MRKNQTIKRSIEKSWGGSSQLSKNSFSVSLLTFGFKRAVIAEIKEHFDKLFSGEGSLKKNAESASVSQIENFEINEILKFILDSSDRSFLRMEKK